MKIKRRQLEKDLPAVTDMVNDNPTEIFEVVDGGGEVLFVLTKSAFVDRTGVGVGDKVVTQPDKKSIFQNLQSQLDVRKVGTSPIVVDKTEVEPVDIYWHDRCEKCDGAFRLYQIYQDGEHIVCDLCAGKDLPVKMREGFLKRQTKISETFATL